MVVRLQPNKLSTTENRLVCTTLRMSAACESLASQQAFAAAPVRQRKEKEKVGENKVGGNEKREERVKIKVKRKE